MTTSPFNRAADRDSELEWLGRLSPDQRGAVVPASTQSLRSRAAQAVSPAAVEWAVEVGADVARRIVQHTPAYGDSPDGSEILRMGTESTTIQLLMALAGLPIAEAVTPESLACVADFVARGIELDAMLRSIQLGHAVMSSAFLVAFERLGERADRVRSIQSISERQFAFFDNFSAQMAAGYREEQARWIASAVSVRFELVRSVLQSHAPSVPRGVERLGYDLQAEHVALIVWSSTPLEETDASRPERAAADLLRQMHCSQSLVVTAGSGVVWAWGTPADPGRDEPVAPVLRRADDLHAVLGSSARGVEGFRRSHREAEAVIASRVPEVEGSRVVPYREVDLLSLLVNDRIRAREFAMRELGPLAADTPHADDLRKTVAAFLDEQGSPQSAALKLNVSRNTVSYRVRRAEELMGRPLAERRLQLRAALLIRTLLGPSAG